MSLSWVGRRAESEGSSGWLNLSVVGLLVLVDRILNCSLPLELRMRGDAVVPLAPLAPLAPLKLMLSCDMFFGPPLLSKGRGATVLAFSIKFIGNGLGFDIP
jgi:hypothetical protein